MTRRTSRRAFLATTASGTIASTIGYSKRLHADDANSKNDRPTIAVIGAGYQPETRRQGRGIALGVQATQHADIAVVCEVDQHASDSARERFAKQAGISSEAIEAENDYRRVLDRSDIDAVIIATPDHWHTKIAIEAMAAGKDVYLEKPATVTIDEGKQLRAAVKRFNRVLQVGTQQRTEYGQRFLRAIAMVRSGCIGNVTRVHVGLNAGNRGGPFPPSKVPETLNWERWQGPAPLADYLPARTHRTFRWWYEYAGGQLCDWGAHHVDIAQWAIGQADRGPISVEGTSTMNQTLKRGMPTEANRYNTPIEFSVSCQYDNGIEILIDSSRNGITFEGDQGRFFVNRGTLEGKPVDSLRQHPLPAGAIRSLHSNPDATSHMHEFFLCCKSRRSPTSDITSHHRILTTCHLANIALRVGRKLTWDWQTEQIEGDEIASSLMRREYRRGYEIEV